MKKFILILIVLLFSMPCIASESFILMIDKDYTDVKVTDETIINLTPVQNINNEGKAMLLTPKKEGSVIIKFKKGKKGINVKVRVTTDRTDIQHVNGVKVVPVNLPAELK